MARTMYRNGDSISLPCGCNGCSPTMINGMLCHESGCPDAWRDEDRECFECGCTFQPTYRWAMTCDDCLAIDDDTHEETWDCLGR